MKYSFYINDTVNILYNLKQRIRIILKNDYYKVGFENIKTTIRILF